jgi:DNA-binding CsgD family transcriptional regulator
MTEGIERASAERLPFWSCVFLVRRALSAQRHGERELAIRFARDAIRAAQAIGYERVVARAEQVLAVARGDELGADGSRALFLANLRAHEAAGDLRGVASTMAVIGSVIGSSDAPTAARWFRDGLATARKIGYWHGEAYCVLGMAALLTEVGNMPEAARLHAAMQPYVPVMQASIPPEYFAGYPESLDAARSAVGAAAFAEAAAELAGDWEAVRSQTAILAAQLADTDAGPRSEAPPRQRRGRNQPSELSARELEVLSAIARGRSNPQIAADLHLSAKTVMHHSTSVYRKLGVRGRAEAVAAAYQSGLLTG